jgi:hypothetical protein
MLQSCPKYIYENEWKALPTSALPLIRQRGPHFMFGPCGEIFQTGQARGEIVIYSGAFGPCNC